MDIVKSKKVSSLGYLRFLLYKIKFQPLNYNIYFSRKNLSKELGPVGNDAVNSSLLAVPLATVLPIDVPIFHTGSQQTERKRGRKSIAVNAFNQVIYIIYVDAFIPILHLSIFPSLSISVCFICLPNLIYIY